MENITTKIKNYFKDLWFEEKEHRYTYKGKVVSISVSGLIKRHSNEFNSNAISLAISRRGQYSQQEVLAQWEEKAEEGKQKGNDAHNFAEKYAYDRTLLPTNNYQKAVVAFYTDLPEHIQLVEVELKMYNKQYKFAGTCDILFYNTKTQKYIIGDFKTNIDLFKNYKNQKLKFPFSFLLDCSFGKYELQLSYYQLLLEQLNIEVEKRKIIHLLPDGTYIIYDTQDLTQLLTSELDEHENSRNIN